jgi:lipopolysaccharide/colanic/teichoic acid biosynthesis glycosyltransferase
MALLAALIKLESQGPTIYRQRRLGRGLRPFEMLKFRSMIVEAEQETGPVWAPANDPALHAGGAGSCVRCTWMSFRSSSTLCAAR